MKKNLVVQSNKLIEAHYKQEYSVQEQRMVLWMISEIHKEDYFYVKKSECKTITISVKNYANVIGTNPDNVYRYADKIGDALMSKVITIKKEDGSWSKLNWVSSMDYIKGKAQIKIKVSPDIIPYIIDLKEKFTAFRLENILYLSSAHAIKIYQLLTQYKTIGERVLTIDELRLILGVELVKSYQNYSDFKRRILEISKREINKKTDLLISYSEIKESRKVVAIKFKITYKPRQEEQAKRAFEEWIATLDPTATLVNLFHQNGFGNEYVDSHFHRFIANEFLNYEPTSTAQLQSKITDLVSS